jgi:hypothetical protein
LERIVPQTIDFQLIRDTHQVGNLVAIFWKSQLYALFFAGVCGGIQQMDQAVVWISILASIVMDLAGICLFIFAV